MTWTNQHQQGLENHVRTKNSVPHASIHSKQSFMDWAKIQVNSVLDHRDRIDIGLLVGSIAAILIHHGHPEQEAKEMALKISQSFHDGHTFVGVVGQLWDHFVTHDIHKSEPNLTNYWSGVSQYRSQLRSNP